MSPEHALKHRGSTSKTEDICGREVLFYLVLNDSYRRAKYERNAGGGAGKSKQSFNVSSIVSVKAAVLIQTNHFYRPRLRLEDHKMWLRVKVKVNSLSKQKPVNFDWLWWQLFWFFVRTALHLSHFWRFRLWFLFHYFEAIFLKVVFYQYFLSTCWILEL